MPGVAARADIGNVYTAQKTSISDNNVVLRGLLKSLRLDVIIKSLIFPSRNHLCHSFQITAPDRV